MGHQIPLESYNTRFGVLYQCLMAVALKTASLIPDYFQHRQVKHLLEISPLVLLTLDRWLVTRHVTRPCNLPAPFLTPPPCLCLWIGWSRKIFYKHRGSCFFQPSAYVVAATLVGAPLALLDAILYGSTSR